MVYLRLLATLSCLLAFADAFIRFEHSMIYDEFDFAGHKILSVPLSCTDNGCRVYISMPEASKTIASNLMIADKLTLRTRFSDVALMKQSDGQKGFYNIRKGNSFVNFTNQNANLESAPIMLWIVQGDAPHIGDAQVYDAALFYRSPARAGMVTVMSAEAYTLTTATSGPMTVSARLSGFDLFDNETCTTVLEQDDPATYQEFFLSLRSPLITLFFDGFAFPDSTVAMTAKLEMVDTFDLSKPMFATSPGYISCPLWNDIEGDNSTMTFRSSLYDDPETEYRLLSDRFIQLDVSSDLNIREEAPIVMIEQSNGDVFKWWGSSDAGTAERNMTLRTNGLTISWTRNEEDVDRYFMIRIDPAPQAAGTTTPIPETTNVRNSETTTATEVVVPDNNHSSTADSPSSTTTVADQSAATTVTTTRRTMPPSSEKPPSTSRPILSHSSSTATSSATTATPTTSSSVGQGSLLFSTISIVLLL